MDEARRFSTAADHYLAGRPAYAEALIARVADRVGLGPEDRVMDLGCGPAQLARAFAPLVHDVLAIDPEPEMLRVARAASAGIGNIVFHEGSSASLAPGLGRFRLVTMGRSFHWMDRPDTLRRLEAIIQPGGAIALFHDTHPDLPENAWYSGYRATIRRYAQASGYVAHTQQPDWVRHEGVLLHSAFSRMEEIGVYERRPASIDKLIERALSMSSTSRGRLGGAADTMIAELRDGLPDGEFSEVIVSQALLAWRPG